MLKLFPEDSFIMELFNFVKTKSHAPEEIIFWTIFSFCGASLQDSIYVDFSGKPIFPNFPLMIIAKSGVGKSTSLSIVERIFLHTLPHIIPEDATSESMFKNFAMFGTESYQATSAMWIVSEMSDTFGGKDYQRGLVQRITRLLDNPKDKTISRSSDKEDDDPIRIKGYALFSPIFATTFEWFIKFCDESASIGGFLPRMNPIKCDEECRFTELPVRDAEKELYFNMKLKAIIRAGDKGSQKICPEIESMRHDFYKELTKCHDENERVFLARKCETYLRIYLILRVFSAGFRDHAHILRMSLILCNYVINQGLIMIRDIKMRNIIKVSSTTVRKFNEYLRKNLLKSLKYGDLSKNSRIRSTDMEPILTLYREYEVVAWDGKKGSSSVTVLSDPQKFLDNYLTAGNEDVEEA